MLDVSTEIVRQWDAARTLPQLWADYIPMNRWQEGAFPVAVFGESRYTSELLNGGVKLNASTFQFRVFHTDKGLAWANGREAVTFIEGFEAEGVYKVRVNSAASAVRTELGGLDVWYFEFTADVAVNE